VARRWAAEGYRVILAGRDVPEIERDASDLRLRYGGEVAVLGFDALRFDEHGDPLHYQVGIFQIQNGRHVLLYPRDRATGKIHKPGP
jgi:NAD(P)-dependent dehydrogenase (short-subunit alcohol dehydrogenase family)